MLSWYQVSMICMAFLDSTGLDRITTGGGAGSLS